MPQNTRMHHNSINERNKFLHQDVFESQFSHHLDSVSVRKFTHEFVFHFIFPIDCPAMSLTEEPNIHATKGRMIFKKEVSKLNSYRT